jgi:hypothetical protein
VQLYCDKRRTFVTRSETLFAGPSRLDPDARSRRVFSFHRPETLEAWGKKTRTLRAALRQMPPLITTGLRNCQIDAITNLEESLAVARPRALLQMATGSGRPASFSVGRPHYTRSIFACHQFSRTMSLAFQVMKRFICGLQVTPL